MEALAILKILLILFLLGSTIYSAIVYQGRKKSSLKSLAAFRQQHSPQRKLDPTELRLVDAVIAQAEQKTLGALDSHEVFSLSGPYLRHGLTNNGNTVWHDTIDGVEVLLPYDAEYFLREDNEALVVLAKKKAIVVALNDAFTLAGGEERDQRREQNQQQWERGDYGGLSPIVEEPDASQDSNSDTLIIREQREESDAEIQARRGRGIGLLPAVLWTLAFISLAIAAHSDTGLFLALFLSAGVVFILLALFTTFRRPPLGEPLKVNQVSGQIRLTPIAVDEHNNVQVSVTLNESIGFDLPEHWRPFIQYEDGQHQEMAVRVDDYSVVRYGHRMSLDEEVRRFPLVYWGRHLTLAIVGAIALLFPLSNVTQLSRDILLTSQSLSGAPQRELDNAKAVRDNPPTPGTLAHLKGNARCAVETGSDSPSIDCRQLYWGSSAPRSSHTQAPDIIQRLQDQDLLQPRSDNYLTLMATMQGWDTYRNGKPVMLTNLPRIIETLDSACAQNGTDGDIDYRCQRIHRQMLERLIYTLDPQPESWHPLREAVQQRADTDDPVTAITSEAHIKVLRQQISQLVIALDAGRSLEIAKDINNSQQGGVAIRLVQGPLPAALEAAESHDRSAIMDKLLAMIDAPAGQPFALSGMVTAYQPGSGDAPATLSLDLTRHRDTIKPAAINVLWLLLAAGLLFGHGVMAAVRFAQHRKRHQAVAALYA